MMPVVVQVQQTCVAEDPIVSCIVRFGPDANALRLMRGATHSNQINRPQGVSPGPAVAITVAWT